jgi:hypothetical protein
MVTVLFPTSRGTTADQLVVPLAIPDDPVFVDQVTFATAVLSEAVPVKTSEAEVVEIVVPPGEVIVIDGGVVSLPGDGAGEGVGDGVGVGVGVGAGVGFGFGDGVGVGVGLGLGVGEGDGAGFGEGVGLLPAVCVA